VFAPVQAITTSRSIVFREAVVPFLEGIFVHEWTMMPLPLSRHLRALISIGAQNPYFMAFRAALRFEGPPLGVSAGSQYLVEPSVPAQRRYEALRAYFVDEVPAAEVTERFGYST